MLLTFVQITLVALLLIVTPLVFKGFKGGGKTYSLIHFTGIGIGFMFIEIILIQQFTLYFGHLIYAATAVLSGMLIFSGLGSFFSGTIIKNNHRFAGVIIAVEAGFLYVMLIAALAYSITIPVNLKTTFPNSY